MTSSDFTPVAPKPPSLLVTAVSMVMRHLLTGGAGLLVGWGVIQGSQKTEFMDVGMSVMLWLLAVGWSWYEKSKVAKVTQARVVAAAVTGVVK